MPIKVAISRQFYRPTGLLGAVVGWIMASRRSNVERIRWTVSLLGIKEGDRVLELGFGPGVAIGMSAAATGPKGRVVGIDHSSIMFAQATRRNKALIDEGRVDLRLGSLAQLEDLPGPFDKVFSSNVLQFQRDKTSVLMSVLLLMRPGGRFATTFHPRLPGATAEDVRAFAAELLRTLTHVGFVRPNVFELPSTPVPAVCIVAERPGAADYQIDD
jgi:ubiquinone/menaquinone biosynthesis C-methylase UbiE